MTRLARFLRDPAGAVNVDWVVLTAVSAGFGLMVLITLSSGTLDIAQEVSSALAEAEVVPATQTTLVARSPQALPP